jgi:hypothetical protein
MAFGTALAAGFFSIVQPVHAQEAKLLEAPPPEFHVASAQAAYDAGDTATALAQIEEAYRQSARADWLRALRQAHQAEGDAAFVALALRCYAPTEPLPECVLPATPSADAVLTSAPPSTPIEPHVDVAPPAAPPRDQTGITVAWILTAAGAATVLGATAVGFSAEGTHSSLDDRCGPTRTMCPTGFEADRDRGITLSLVADVLGFGGAAILGTGIAMLFLFQEEEAPPVTAACGPEGCMASVRGSF